MRRILPLLIILFTASYGLSEDCMLDQKKRIENNIKLKAKYQGSYLVEKNQILIIPVKNGKLRVIIGGCSHFGVTIEMVNSRIISQKGEDELMEYILYLSKKYSQGNIDAVKLKDAIKSKRYSIYEVNRFYSINYDGYSNFEVYQKDEEGHTIIGLSFYN